jgi:hypothetical protein
VSTYSGWDRYHRPRARLPWGCVLPWLAFLTFNVALGAWTFSYCLWALTGRTAPWWADAVCGLVGGEVTVPLALILWVLRLAGVETRIG